MENKIGDARREYADRVGKFTQEDAAKFFGVSLSTYKKWEQGQGMMNGEQLREIAIKYDVTVDFLLGVTHESRKTVETGSLTIRPNERELIALYRNMDERHQELLLENARSFSALSVKDGAGTEKDVERIGSWVLIN